MKPLGIEAYLLTIKFHECIFVKRFNKLVVERGWDLSKIEPLHTLVEKLIQPFKEADVSLPGEVKFFVIVTWFRTKSDGGEDILVV